jgi:tight adherence protein C
MELGLPRREALQNLKRRTEVPELSNFVLALALADVLSMPIGRVSHTQAVEMRNKRRQSARKRASKLAMMLLFPLVLFISPKVKVVLLGPAVASIGKSVR